MLNKVLFLLCCALVHSLQEGDPCSNEGVDGFCTEIGRCLDALQDRKNGSNPLICPGQKDDSVVCCPAPPPTYSTTSPQPPTPQTTPFMIIKTKSILLSSRKLGDTNEYDYEYSYDDTCPPIPANYSQPEKTGNIAWNKCLEYQESLVYPCQRGMAGTVSRLNNCHHDILNLIVGGSEAEENEFPHMVLIGYGTLANISWLCGGSIISESYILTAAHCAYVKNLGAPIRVAAGVRKRQEITNSTRIYEVKRVVRHPDYTPLEAYNDVALIEVKTPIVLDQYTVPACLDTGDYSDDGRALATGWGLTKYKGSASDTLQKVVLKRFPEGQCSSMIPPALHMEKGFDPRTQLCYGDEKDPKDTCQGDSGGPLQIKSQELKCMYVVVGVTSSGGGCGNKEEPGVYTNVKHYTPWIGSVVWPDA